MWSKEVCGEGETEVSENKLLKFLKDYKIVSNEKEIDDLYKEGSFFAKGEAYPTPKKGQVTLTFFSRLFQKTLLVIAVENLLSFVDFPTI